MIIYCNVPELKFNSSSSPYRNRPINLANIITFDKSTSTNNDRTLPSIKFTSVLNKGGKGEIFEWLFLHEVERDEMLELIKSKTK